MHTKRKISNYDWNYEVLLQIIEIYYKERETWKVVVTFWFCSSDVQSHEILDQFFMKLTSGYFNYNISWVYYGGVDVVWDFFIIFFLLFEKLACKNIWSKIMLQVVYRLLMDYRSKSSQEAAVFLTLVNKYWIKVQQSFWQHTCPLLKGNLFLSAEKRRTISVSGVFPSEVCDGLPERA